MRWVGVLAVVLTVVYSELPPAAADETSTPIRIKVLGLDGKPVADAEITTKRSTGPNWGVSEAGTTDKNGDFSADIGPPPNAESNHVYTVYAKDKNGNFVGTVRYFSPNSTAPVTISLKPKSESPQNNIKNSIQTAATAAEGGNKDIYQLHLADARKWVRWLETFSVELLSAADAFARDNKMEVKNRQGVVKAIQRIDKLPENLRDKELHSNLKKQLAILDKAEELKSEANTYKQDLENLEAKYGSKLGLLPSACPEGQGGGLLAGTLNSLFDTDLAASNCGQAEEKGTHGKGDQRRSNEHERQ